MKFELPYARGRKMKLPYLVTTRRCVRGLEIALRAAQLDDSDLTERDRVDLQIAKIWLSARLGRVIP